MTQADQDKADEEKQREATQNLVQTWMERLQLISVIVRKKKKKNSQVLCPSRTTNSLNTIFILLDDVLCFD